MDKKIIIIIVVIVVIAGGGLAFFLAREPEELPVEEEISLEEEVASLQERYSGFIGSVSEGELTEEEAKEEMSLLEERMDEIIGRHELEDIVGTTAISRDAHMGLEERIDVFSNRYIGVEKVFFRMEGEARDDIFALQEKYYDFNSDIRRGRLDKEEAEERLIELEETMEEMIEEYNKTKEVEEALSSVDIFEGLGEQFMVLQLFLEEGFFEIEIDEEAQEKLFVVQEDYQYLINDILEGRADKEQAEERLMEVEEKVKNFFVEHDMEEVYERYVKASKAQRAIRDRDMQFNAKLLTLRQYIRE